MVVFVCIFAHNFFSFEETSLREIHQGTGAEESKKKPNQKIGLEKNIIIHEDGGQKD